MAVLGTDCTAARIGYRVRQMVSELTRRAASGMPTTTASRNPKMVSYSVTPVCRTSDAPLSHAAATIAIGAFFFVNGATYASWVPRLPEIRDDLGVSDTALGLTLLGGGLGGLAVSLVSGRVVDRVGSRIATITTSLVLSAVLPLVGFAPVPAVLFATLLTIGAFDGLTDIAMNSQALQLQRLQFIAAGGLDGFEVAGGRCLDGHASNTLRSPKR